MNLLQDLREILARGEQSALRKDKLRRKVDKFERDLRRVGGSLDSQLEFCKSLSREGEATLSQWMFRFCAVRLLRGDYSDWTGWEYRNEWAVSTYAPWASAKRWRLEPVESIAVLGEQGIGDEIMFSTVLPDLLLRIPKVTVECDKRLIPAFERFGVTVRERQNLDFDRPEQMFIPMGDLCRLFRKSRESFPDGKYLTADPEKVEKWKHLKGRVGVAWRGRRGSFKPEDFGLKDAVCLQYDAWPVEVKGMEVPQIGLRNDVEDLFGICANLSKIVTVPQTIVHIAGSIGTPCDVVMPPVSSGRKVDNFNYRYGLGTRMDWYSQHRVFQNMKLWKSAS